MQLGNLWGRGLRAASFALGRRRAALAAILAAILAATAGFGLGPAAAGAPGAADAAAYCAEARSGEECLVVHIDHLSQLPVAAPVKTMLVGNPAIADATLLTPTHAVITARAVGSTNIVFLDGDNAPIAQYRVFVREAGARRVMLRRGPEQIAEYQCSPRCERTLSQNDSPKLFSEQQGKVRSASALASGAANGGD